MKVYIDGENCRKGLVRVLIDKGVIKNERELQTFRLRDLLADVLGTNDLTIVYYASKIKLPTGYKPSREIMKQVETIKQYSRKWVANLEQQQNIGYIKAGLLKIKTSKKCPTCGSQQDILQEKGVDVRIAVDVLDDTYSNKQKSIVIMSSDTDLCPVMHRVIAKGVHVTYVCFADAANRAVAAVANETVTIPITKVGRYVK